MILAFIACVIFTVVCMALALCFTARDGDRIRRDYIESSLFSTRFKRHE